MGNDDTNTGKLENSISLTQSVNANSGGCCCDGLTEVKSYIKHLKKEIEMLMEVYGLNASSGKV